MRQGVFNKPISQGQDNPIFAMLSRAIFEKFKEHFEKGSGKSLVLSGIG